MKVLLSSLARDIRRDPVAWRAMVEAVDSGRTFQFQGKNYRPMIDPRSLEFDAPSIVAVKERQ